MSSIGSSALVDEEHDLVGKASPGEPLSEADEVRLGEVEIRLDQCWDLLRQRRAAATPGSIPATQRFAGAETVEGYQQ